MPQDRRVGVGVCTLIHRQMPSGEWAVLLGQRKSAFATGVYSTPGGWLELGETFEVAGRRELHEETGLTVTGTAELLTTIPGLHRSSDGTLRQTTSIYLWFPPETIRGEPETLEPDKCAGWLWYPLSDLPAPLFPGLELALPYSFEHTLWVEQLQGQTKAFYQSLRTRGQWAAQRIYE